MAQLIACPECGKHLQVPDGLIGKDVQCPECRHTFVAAEAAPKKRPAEAPPKPPSLPAWEKEASVSKSESKRKRRDDDEDDCDKHDDRDEDEDEDDVDVRRSRSRRRSGDDKPGKVTGLGVMALVGGIVAVLLGVASVGVSFGMCCLWPGTYYSLIVGILAIVKDSALLGENAAGNPPPTGTAIMMIINIVNADVLNLVLGIIMLVFCADEEVTEYLSS